MQIFQPADSQRVFIQTQAVTVGNTANETALTGTGIGSLVLPTNFFTVGKTLTIIGLGYHSATANPTLDIKVKFGSNIVLDSGAVSTANSTNAGVEIRGLITCITTGSSGTLLAQGFWIEDGAGANVFGMVNTSTVAIDTTASQTISITAQWGAQNPGNTITLSNLVIEYSK